MSAPMRNEDGRIVYSGMIRLTRAVAQWIVNHGRLLLTDGYNQETGEGVLDDIPIDTEVYRYVQELYRLVQTIVGILANEVDEIENGHDNNQEEI